MILQVIHMQTTCCSTCGPTRCTSRPDTHVFLRLPTARRIDLGPPLLQPRLKPNIHTPEPPQLNGSGSISKASRSCLSLWVQFNITKCARLGVGNLTALNSSKTELQWRAHNIMSLTREAQRSLRQHAPVEHQRHPGRWRDNLDFHWSVCDCMKHTAPSKHPSLVARAGFNKESFTEIPLPPSFLPQVIYWFLCHPLLLFLLLQRCRSVSETTNRPLRMLLLPPEFFWDVDSSVWAENNDSTYKAQTIWGDNTCASNCVLGHSFWLALSFTAIH